jgi:serine/threonine-protein kinase
VLADKAGAPFPPNTMLDEKYRLDELIEVGGMGAVYIGTHTRLQKQVAIKVLRRELTDMPDMIERFQREAVSASRIGHENIVNVSDLGTARDGSPFLVMEYLTGQTLRDRIRDQGALPIGVAATIAREILAAITAAHQAGIIHRDLKPENVFLVRGTRGESIKILDFGISRVMEAREGGPDGRLTATGQVMGTPYYMAPEQAAGRSDIGGAVDVYAMGVILYEMLAGVVPFSAGNYNTIIYKVLAGEYEPLSSRLGGVPPDLEQLVHRAMAREPEHRFASADVFSIALEPYAIAGSTSQRVPLLTDPFKGWNRKMDFAPTVTPAGEWRPAQSGGLEMQTTRDPPPASARRRRRWVALAIALPVVAAGVATAALLVGERGGPDHEPVAASRAVPEPAAAAPEGGAASAAPDPDAPGSEPSRADAPARREPAAPPAVVAPARVTLRFEVAPVDATITVDGEPLAGTELTAERADREVEVAISRDGYLTKTRRVALADSRTVEVILEKTPEPRRARPAKQRPRKGERGERIIKDSPYE